MNIARSKRITNERGGTLTGSLMLTVLFSVGLVAAKDNFQQALQVKTENRYIGNTVPDVVIFFQPGIQHTTPSQTGPYADDSDADSPGTVNCNQNGNSGPRARCKLVIT